MDKDHYKILGITRKASDAEIRRAYLTLVLRYHPDKNKATEAASKFRKIDTAYKVLINKESRKDYDRKLEEEDFKRDTSGVGNQGENFSSARFGGKEKNASFRFSSGAPWGSATSGDTPFGGTWRRAESTSSGFGTPSGAGTFGGANFARQSTNYQYGPGFSAPYNPSPGRSEKFSANSRTPGSTEKTHMKQNPAVEYDVFVTLHEVFRGCTKNVKIARTVVSEDGRTSKSEKIFSINVKPGMQEGTKVTFPREGDQIPGTIPADVVFIIRDAPHPQFNRKGLNLCYTAKVTDQQVIDGEVIIVPTLTAEKVAVPLNVTCFSADVKRYQGHGFPHPNDCRLRGDLHISFDVVPHSSMGNNYSYVF